MDIKIEDAKRGYFSTLSGRLSIEEVLGSHFDKALHCRTFNPEVNALIAACEPVHAGDGLWQVLGLVSKAYGGTRAPDSVDDRAQLVHGVNRALVEQLLALAKLHVLVVRVVAHIVAEFFASEDNEALGVSVEQLLTIERKLHERF